MTAMTAALSRRRALFGASAAVAVLSVGGIAAGGAAPARLPTAPAARNPRRIWSERS